MDSKYIDYCTPSIPLKVPNNQYFGCYRGTVLKNDDSGSNQSVTFNRGRCKIYVPGIYPEEFKQNDGEQLPWAEPCQPLFCGGSGVDGTFQCPDINATVWLFFESGDITRPVFFGQTTSEKGEFNTEICREEWRDMKIEFNHKVKDDEHNLSIYAKTDINETAEKRNINRTAGLDIVTNAGQDIKKDAKRNIVINAGDSITIKAKNSIKIEAPTIDILGSNTISISNGSISINGSTVNITGGSGDAKIQSISLVTHKHPVPPHCPSAGITTPPIP